ncbi:hypothetical protein ACFFX0_12745 [Citricoccus parietis]|uniref:Uncharacterized protein n=1 Tax=Citricoccus parietis TaxID=592307 RepID=A0ABV5FZE8_9MICC
MRHAHCRSTSRPPRPATGNPPERYLRPPECGWGADGDGYLRPCWDSARRASMRATASSAEGAT